MDYFKNLVPLTTAACLLLASHSTQLQAEVDVGSKSGKEAYYELDDFRSVKKYDTHIHFNTDDTAFLVQAGEDNFRILDIVDDRPFGLPMSEQQKFAIQHFKRYPQLMSFATTFSVKDWDNADWPDKTLDELKRSFAQGAVAVKIWKNIGMALRDKTGKFIMVDDPRLDPILNYLEENQITLIGHNGEPRDCWQPLEKMTVKGNREYYRQHPEYHMYLHPEYPKYEDQIRARDHMLEKHPRLKFVGAHLGSLEWSLDELAKRLDRYPNMAVDISRMANLQLDAQEDWQKTHDFFVKYQDRLLYGTDRQVGAIKDVQAFKKEIHDSRMRDWKFFTSNEIMHSNGVDGEFRGLHLPREVIDKLYGKNAEKWVSGLKKG